MNNLVTFAIVFLLTYGLLQLVLLISSFINSLGRLKAGACQVGMVMICSLLWNGLFDTINKGLYNFGFILMILTMIVAFINISLALFSKDEDKY